MTDMLLIEKCINLLPGHGPRKSVRDTLQDLVDHLSGDEAPDNYGSDEYLKLFEQRLATMFGKESAVFMPWGTMAHH